LTNFGPHESAPQLARPTWLKESLFPFQSRWVRIRSCLIHYVDEGRGQPLVFLHGNPTWSFLYRELVRGLSDRFRCVALDYPGFGLSKAHAGYDFKPRSHAGIVEEFISALRLRQITLMVHDWGGPIGFWVATEHPEWFQAFIVGNTWAWPLNGDPHFERFSKLMGGPIGGFLIRNFNAAVNLMLPAGLKRHKPNRQTMWPYRKVFPTRQARVPTHVFPREILYSADFLSEVSSGLPRLAKHPALITWGDKDIAFREQERKRFEEVFPRHETVILKGAGHYIQEDAPEEIVTAIRNWREFSP
jgi:haloalkane dehalogenase